MSEDGFWVVWTSSRAGGLVGFEASATEEGAYHDAYMAVEEMGRKVIAIERPDRSVVDQGQVEAYLDRRFPWRHNPPTPAVARLIIKPPVDGDPYDSVIYDEEFVEEDYRCAVERFGTERVELKRLA
ncbi:hypothetical protein [Mycobacteroides abscessus]|uniref:hypothetical protein n=1 Tax=Mycobacteroides abscessus TaxID=36809 RepID=UPI0009C8D388|nr:hypothetical protein [Mycobacteroides abscessus]SLH43246.1 Uncharacterised protein [Mycobacteroides abscessus subsp. abscessus]